MLNNHPIHYKAKIKDSALEGLNKAFFEKYGKIFEVTHIDYEQKQISIRCPSILDFNWDEVELIPIPG